MTIEAATIFQGPMDMLPLCLAVMAIVTKFGDRFFKGFALLPHVGIVAGCTPFLQCPVDVGQPFRGIVVALQAEIVTIGQQGHFPRNRKIVAVLTILFHWLVDLSSHIAPGRLFPGRIKGNEDTLPVDLKDVDTPL